MTKVLHFLVIILFSFPCIGICNNLPEYSLYVSDDAIISMNHDPFSDTMYQASIRYNGINYPCQVRYRGNTARTLPKKSWKIEYLHSGPFGESSTIFNAELRDTTLLRNHLFLKLANDIGLTAPESQHVQLFVNGISNGVYLQIEPIDNLFFDRRGIDRPYNLLKVASSNYNNFTPFTNIAIFHPKNEIKRSESLNFTQLGMLTNYLNEAPTDSILELSPDPCNLNFNNIALYFALIFSTYDIDGITKNYYINEESSRQISLIPWDGDATFGNHWSGRYRSNFKEQTTLAKQNNNALFSRLSEINEFRNLYFYHVRHTIPEAFPHLSSYATATASVIKYNIVNDPFLVDQYEHYTSFVDSLTSFISFRTSLLSSLAPYDEYSSVIDYDCNPCYVSTDIDSIQFSITFSGIVNNCCIDIFNKTADRQSFPMLLTNINNDYYTYVISISVSEIILPFEYCFHYNICSNSPHTFPVGPGFSYGTNYPFTTAHPSCPMVHTTHSPENSISIVNFRYDSLLSNKSFTLFNHSEFPINLSGCILRTNNSYRMLRLPFLEPLLPEDELLITSDPATLMNIEHDATRVIGPYFGIPDNGDTLSFCMPDFDTILQIPAFYTPFNSDTTSTIVLNEINYHSSERNNSGDWVELYFRKPLNISNYSLFNDQKHLFTFPADTYSNTDSYIILAKNKVSFESVHGKLTNTFYSDHLSLSGSCNKLNIRNRNNSIVDIVYFTDDNPWPSGADGSGRTLELRSTELDNNQANNWTISAQKAPFGTPGRVNSCSQDTTMTPDSNLCLLEPYPNPSDGIFFIPYTSNEFKQSCVHIYNILGELVGKETFWIQPGCNRKRIDILSHEEYASGVYFISLDCEKKFFKKIFLVK